jgi:ABC-type polysaccharide/polyol phosphate export permease
MIAWPEREALTRRLEIVRELALADFRMKYQGSALGYAWSMLSPLLMLGIYFFVFRYVLDVRTPGYFVYLLVGLVYWTFVQDCSFSGLVALSAKAGVLRSIHLAPGWVVLAGALSTMITLLINTLVLIVTLACVGRLSPYAPLALFPLVCLVLLATGTAFLVARAHVSFRDTGLIWGILLQAWFWLTPVVYTVEPGTLAEILYLNPLARCLILLRWFLVYDYLPPLRFAVFTFVACATVFGAGTFLFLRRQHTVPEAL